MNRGQFCTSLYEAALLPFMKISARQCASKHVDACAGRSHAEICSSIHHDASTEPAMCTCIEVFMNFCIHCILYNIFGTQDVLWAMCSTNGDGKDGHLTSRDLADESCASILASFRCLSHVSALLKGSCLDGLEPMFPLRLHHNPHARYKSPTHAG